jgi:hypothetical protein
MAGPLQSFVDPMVTPNLLQEPQDKRKHRRAHIQRVSVRYELAPDHFILGDVLEMSVEGMFVHASKPLPVGRLFTLEIRVLGEALPIDAVGRVMWRREASETEKTENHPSGFGVKLVDLDEAASALLGRLVAVRQQTMSGIGSESPNCLPPRASEVSVPFNLVRPPRATEPSIPFPLVTPLHVPRAPEASVPFPLLIARQRGTSRPAPRAGRSAQARSRGSARRLVAAVAFFGLVVLLPQDGAGAPGRDRETFAAIAAAASAGRTVAGAAAGTMTGWVMAMTRKSPWHEPLGSAMTAGSSRPQER